jgi:hypothetical protein
MITENEFEELLNENSTTVLGRWFGNGTILRKCDPVSFHVEYHTYCASVEDAIEEEKDAGLLEDALALLNHNITVLGMEYPDALYHTVKRYRTVKKEELQQAYDSQF